MKWFLALGLVVLLTTAGTQAAGTQRPDAQSAAQYFCVYSKAVLRSKVYLVLGVDPYRLGPTLCRTFNGGFHGKRVSNAWARGRIGTAHCMFGRTISVATLALAVYSRSSSIGRAYCALFKPGADWIRVK